MKRSPKKPRPSSIPRILLWSVFGIILVVGVILPLILEPVVLRFVNRKLDEMPGYRGHVEAVHIHLWRGAYSIEQIRLDKVDGKVPVPFFSARDVDLSVEWKALFQGKIVSEITLDHPTLNFVAGPTDKQSQTGIDGWQKVVEDLFPFTINRFEIREGDIHFRDFHQKPRVDIHLDHLNAIATGLTNAQEQSSSLPARFNLTGRAMDHAPLSIDMKIAPLALQPTFDLNAELKDLKLVTLNDYFNAYALIDVEGGTLSLFTEMTAQDGGFKGYIKPLTKDIDILSLKHDSKNPLRLAWEATVAAVAQIFENQPKSQVGTQIPFSGRFSDPKPDVWKTVGTLLRNAFIRALNPKLDNSIQFQGTPGIREEKRQKKEESQKS